MEEVIFQLLILTRMEVAIDRIGKILNTQSYSVAIDR